jgi:hypothetical protein
MSESTGRDKAHEEFVRPGPLPAGANLPDAEARLLKALEQELGVPLAEAPKPQLKIVRPNRLKPLLAFAAVGLATAGLVWSLGSLKGDKAILRGHADQGSWSADARATKVDARRTRLTWNAAPGATSYTVTFLSSDLSEVAHVDGIRSATYLLDRDALPAGLASAQPVLWRVSAFKESDELSRSASSQLEVP